MGPGPPGFPAVAAHARCCHVHGVVNAGAGQTARVAVFFRIWERNGDSEGNGCAIGDALATLGVVQFESLRVELQSGRRMKRLAGCIERVAEDRVPEAEKVHAQLVGASGNGVEFHARRAVVVARQDLVVGHRLAPLDRVDHLLWPVGPVAAQGQVDGALVSPHVALNPRHIGFRHMPALELQAEMTMGRARHGKGQNAGGVHVQTVHDPRAGIALRRAACHAVLKPLALAGNAQQPARLVDDQKVLVMMHDVEEGLGRRPIGAGGWRDEGHAP